MLEVNEEEEEEEEGEVEEGSDENEDEAEAAIVAAADEVVMAAVDEVTSFSFCDLLSTCAFGEMREDVCVVVMAAVGVVAT